LKSNRFLSRFRNRHLLFLKITQPMKKTDKYFCVYNEEETKMYGMFPKRVSALEWVKKIQSVVKEPLIIKESTFELELPDGIGFSNEKTEWEIDEKLTPMENMAQFIEWSHEELKDNLDKTYEGLVALEIMKSIMRMGRLLKQAEDTSNIRLEEKLKTSHKQYLEAGKIFGIEFMLTYTYDFWRNQDEKDALVSFYYEKMQKK